MDRREQLALAAELELRAQRGRLAQRELMGQPEVPDYLAQRGWLVVREVPVPRALSGRLAQQARQVQQAYKARREQRVALARRERAGKPC